MPLPDDPRRDAGRGARSLIRAISWAIVLVAGAATALLFLSVDRHSHSVSDTIYGMVVPEGIVVVLAAAALLLVRARAGSAP